MTARKSRLWILASIVGIIVLPVLAYIVLTWLGLASLFFSPTVEFVLPNDYRGIFRIVLDEPHGLTIKEQALKYTYIIPRSGILRVNTFKPFQRWHKGFARYQNGTEIPMDPKPGSTEYDIPPDIIGCRGGSESQNGDGPRVINYVVGTQREADQAMKDVRKAKM